MSGARAIAALAGIDPAGTLGAALEARGAVLDMTGKAEEAVLRPKAPGAWSHALRAALAARIARLNGLSDIAERHAATSSGPESVLADPAQDGADLGLAPVVAFMDKVAAQPRDITAEDIAALQAAGIADADIVRLAELNAFLAYQYRLVAGLRLLTGEGAQ